MLERSPVEDLPDTEDLFAPLAGYPHVAAAVSGGADSLALMLLMAEWSYAAQVPVTVYTVDHGLRPEAADECAYVAEQASRLGLQVRTLEWTGAKPQSGVQAAAREARYRLMMAAMAEDGAPVLVTAHHREDQAETILMRLAHGSGVTGLVGMRPMGSAEGVPVFRPLLGVSKATLAELVERAGLTPVTDPSNDDTHYERVRWRALLPQLAEEGLDASRLAGFSARMARADWALDRYTDQAFDELVKADPFGVLLLPLADFQALPDEIAVRLLRRCVNWAGAETKPHTLQPLECLAADLMATTEPLGRTLGGAKVVSDSSHVTIFREAGRMGSGEIHLMPGDSLTWDQRFRILNGGDAPVSIVSGESLTRQDLADFAGVQSKGAMEAVAAAPLVRSVEGDPAAVGRVIREGQALNISLTLRVNDFRQN